MGFDREKKPNAEDVIQTMLARVIDAFKSNSAFEGRGDMLISLSENQAALQANMREVTNDLLQSEIRRVPGKKMNAKQTEEIYRLFVERMPMIIEEMKKETEARMVASFFERYYYSADPSAGGEKRVALPEPSADRIRRGAKEEIIRDFMQTVQGKNLVNINKYGFSEKNLEFLQPKLSNLVDQLLADYRAQINEK